MPILENLRKINTGTRHQDFTTQMACAVGGLITIDFVEPMTPVVEKIDFDFKAQNHSLIIVQTGKGHADLSAEYSSIPEEMKKVAKYFGKDVLAQISEEKVIQHLPER